MRPVVARQHLMASRWRRSSLAFLLAFVAWAVFPPTSANAETAFTSDDFNATLLHERWALVDPAGDGTVAVTGAGSGQAFLELSVPEGSSHDAWGQNRSLRVVQAVADAPFVAETAFGSIPKAKYQMQGLLVEQDADNWLRFDVYHDGKTLRAFAASTVAGSSSAQLRTKISASGTVALRVERTGDSWTLAVSTDGGPFATVGSFTSALAPTSVGPFVGNHAASGSSPAFTALVDYVFDMDMPIVPEDEPYDAPTYTLTRTVEGSGSISSAPDEETYTQGAEVQLDALPSPGWAFHGWSGDVAGTSTPVTIVVESDTAVTATFVEDTTPPTVSDVAVSTTPTAATVSWTTDEPTSGTVDYGTTDAYGDSVTDGTTATTHHVEIVGLAPSTTYHYRINAVDAGSNMASTPDATFTTADEPASGSFHSDDFAGGLDETVWSVVDPVGDGAVSVLGAGTADVHLELSVPGGVSHDAWGSSNRSLRIMQQVADADLGLEARFDTVPTTKYQMQGLLVTQGDNDWVRFDVFHDGKGTRLFAASTASGSSKARINTPVSVSGPSVWLRVDRIGSEWTLAWSSDGSSWHLAGSFSHALTVAAAGPFVANHHRTASSTPAFTALVDYVFDSASPIIPEDGYEPPPDTEPPVISSVAVVATDDSAAISWSTDELADSRVEYGLTSEYADGSVHLPDPTTDHRVTLSGLQPSTTYHFQVASTDAAGNTARTADATFTTAAEPTQSGPSVDVWYGDQQTFGANGQPQRWVNVLGNASDPDGVTTVTYRVNGGPALPLSLGPDNRRLQHSGDFNVELDYADLREGSNEVRLEATDGVDHRTERVVTVEKVTAAAPLPYVADLSQTTHVGEYVQVIDGLWSVDSGGLRTARPGFDRFLGFGDVLWAEYEVEIEFTVLGFGAEAGQSGSGHPLVGLALRWPGHTNLEGEQPSKGFYPAGGFAWYRWASTPKLELTGNDGSPVRRTSDVLLEIGVPYRMKAAITDTVSGTTAYQVKLWPVAAAEPASWQLGIEYADGPVAGGAGFLAHHVDARIAHVEVRPVSGG